MSASNGRATGKTARFDAARTKRLRRAYNAAMAKHLDTFIFEGSELVAGYAKYLLEYLGDHFK